MAMCFEDATDEGKYRSILKLWGKGVRFWTFCDGIYDNTDWRGKCGILVNTFPKDMCLDTCSSQTQVLWTCNLYHTKTETVIHPIYTDISYLKTSWAFQHSDPLKSSPGSHSQSVSGSVHITSSCLLLIFSLLVRLPLLHLHCLCFLVSISNL